MPTSNIQVKRVLQKLLSKSQLEDYEAQLQSLPPDVKALPKRVPDALDWSNKAVTARAKLLEKLTGVQMPYVVDAQPINDLSMLQGNIENCIGFARVPIGVVGPLRINGLHAKGDFYVPMATTEGALVASYQRGAWLVSRSGGIRAISVMEQMQRAPCFLFKDSIEASKFIVWVSEHFGEFQTVVAAHSRFAELEEVRFGLNGSSVYVILGYTTGEAAGQNMVTICTEAVCHYMLERCGSKPVRWFVEGNLSGDKKATAASFLFVRGKSVTAEIVIPQKLVKRILKTTVQDMVQYWSVSIVGGIQSGSIGVQGHFANGLAAIFIACGQDAACVAEAAVGLTRMRETETGDLYVSVNLPNLSVGTVGGGTRLPTQRECLLLLGCQGTGSARKFAEICASAVLAGEISIIGSLASGDFAKAHEKYGRPKKRS